ncbi:hypothetical protein R5R35_004629 [Gryllus longicercus]|uniref:Cyclin N-terminal domain-containing protein n=1 Tax=Gryllus longicercus TaxID=2509291 RepID=A0AAN9W192_9ORTH
MDCCFPDVSSETMEIWWVHLKQFNKNYIKRRAKLKMPFFAASQKMATLICNIGHSMKLSREILLSSVLLFDRFMSFSFNKMNEEKSNIKKEQWMETLQNSMVLTICSCLQLSSKALGQHQVQVTDILKFMLEHNHKVTKTEVLKSEQSVFKTLMYKVPAFSPLIYVETLVHLLPVKKLNLACSVFMETCVQFMMIAYCHHQVLYDSLYYIFTSKETCLYKDRVEFLRVELDQLYLAGAVVVAAVRVLAPEAREASDWLLSRVRHLTGIPTREVMRLATILSDIAADVPENPKATTRPA